MYEAKYLEIADKLESKIEDCHWEGKLPGLSVLSKEFGVNSRTVSKALKALSLKGTVTIKPSSGTFICRDHKVLKQHGAIGVLGLLHDNKRQLELDIVEDQAKKKDYHVLSVDHCKDIFRKKPDILLNMPVDGFIFTNSLLAVDIVESLSDANIPFVSVNRISEIKNVSWVDFDHEKAHKELLEYLLELGHRRIAYVSFQENLQEHCDRMMNTYKSVLEPLGLFDPDLYIHDGNAEEYYSSYGEHYCSIFGMDKALHLMNMADRPTAVVVAGYAIAQGFCLKARQMGLDIPSDVSVVSTTQNHQEAENESFLMMLAGATRKRAARATDILLELINSPQAEPIQELIDIDLMKRDSVCPPKVQEF